MKQLGRTTPALVALLLGILVLAGCHDSDDDGGASGPLESLGVSALSVAGDNGLWLLEVSEADEGGTDLNGDGDTTDDVAFLHRTSDGSVTNLGVALAQPLGGGPSAAVVGDVLVVLRVLEAAQGGADLNGDGDDLDTVLHVYDDNTGTVTSTALAVALLDPAVGAGSVAFGVSEADQDGTDLDGSGTAAGIVLHVYDARTGLASNAQRNVTSEIVFHDHAFAFTTDEASSKADLNADGDESDAHVFEMYDLLLGGVEQVPLAVRGQRPLAVNADDWFLLADEADEGADLNGDLDLSDGVLHEVHPHQGTQQALAYSALDLFDGTTSGTLVALRAQEIDGFDRNGDGDLLDSIAVIHDQASGATRTGLPASTTARLTFAGTQLGFLAHEGDAGLDLNQDGDELDDVLEVLDGTDGSLLDTGLDALSLQEGGGRLVFARAELQVGTDHNGDGDVEDVVLFHLDPLTGVLGNTGIAGAALAEGVTARWILFRAFEATEGRDLNADGDELDVLYVAHDLEGGAPQVLGVAGPNPGAGLAADGRGVLLLLEDGVDRNGDGDGDDTVAHALTLP